MGWILGSSVSMLVDGARKGLGVEGCPKTGSRIGVVVCLMVSIGIVLGLTVLETIGWKEGVCTWLVRVVGSLVGALMGLWRKSGGKEGEVPLGGLGIFF